MNWQKMSVARKMAVGFGGCVILISVLAFLNYYSLNRIKNLSKKVETSNNGYAFLLAKEIDHLKWIANINELFLNEEVNELSVETDDHKYGLGKWLYGGVAKAMAGHSKENSDLIATIKKNHERLHHSAIAIENASQQEAKQIFFSEIKTALADTQKILANLKNNSGKEVAAATDDMSTTLSKTAFLINTLSLAAIIMAVLFALFITRAITKQLGKSIDGLNAGSEQVNRAASHIAASSQNLASSSSEQAAANQQIAASIEEMSSMTRQNAENTSEATSHMGKVNSLVEKNNEAMESLKKSIAETSLASKETSKIIKTINEIAFQTNLLSLNAAIEATRAGKAGSWFAVVAEEVRNLALRSSQAAKETTELIEKTVAKTKEDSSLVNHTSKSFQEIMASTRKVSQFVTEISMASTELAKGIDEINSAVLESDSMMQQIASQAEESASASEELNAQSEQAREYAQEIALVVRGAKGAMVKEIEVQETTMFPENIGNVNVSEPQFLAG